MSYLTHEDIRNYLIDIAVEDNDFDLDLSFSPEQIDSAMQRAARAYNSIPPYGVSSVNGNHLPNDTNVFLDATVEQLYISELAKLTRNDIDYTAGGVGTNLVAKRIAHLTQGIKDCRERWKEVATNIKLTRNLKSAFREY